VSDLRAQMDSVVALATNAMSNLQVLEAATPPEESAGRTPVMLALLGVILGLLLAYGIMFVVELLDGRFYTSEAVERLTHLPILGELARHRRGRSIDVDSTFALQATLENSLDPISQATILVVGTGPQDDTATT